MGNTGKLYRRAITTWLSRGPRRSGYEIETYQYFISLLTARRRRRTTALVRSLAVTPRLSPEALLWERPQRFARTLARRPTWRSTEIWMFPPSQDNRQVSNIFSKLPHSTKSVVRKIRCARLNSTSYSCARTAMIFHTMHHRRSHRLSSRFSRVKQQLGRHPSHPSLHRWRKSAAIPSRSLNYDSG